MSASSGSFSFHVPPGATVGARFFDVWRGVELTPTRAQGSGGGGGGVVSLSASSADEYGAVAMVSAATASSKRFTQLLARMKNLSATPLVSLSAAQVPSFEYKFKTNEDFWVPHVAAASVSHVLKTNFSFEVQSLLWENYLFVKYPMGPATVEKMIAGKVATVNANLALGAFDLDTHPVTNAEYAVFLAASNYTPADPINFVKHWGGTKAPPASIGKKPVVFVSYHDAERYCHFYKRRLPNEWEWSLAMQGTDHRRWPWGNASDIGGRCMPPTYNGLKSPADQLPDVDAFDKHNCASPYGAQMMVGTVWQWTNELQDAHQRTGIVKGGSLYFRSNVSQERSAYFFPNCAKERWKGYGGRMATIYPAACQGELYLQDGGSERSSTIGFRCAVEAGPQPPPSPPPPPPRPGPGTDLRWFDSAAGSYSWSNGSPDAKAAKVKSGVYTDNAKRSFKLSVKLTEGTLRLYVGGFCTSATLTATVDGSKAVSKKALKRYAPPPACDHSTGTRNAYFEVAWRKGPLSLTFSKGAGEEEGNITWQSAAVSAAKPCSGGASVCVADPMVFTTTQDLSAAGSVDWTHWGGIAAPKDPSNVWEPVVKKGGPGILKAELV